jgi:mono/diheme cytochrome c family protein
VIVAANQSAIGSVVFLLALVIAGVYAFVNIRQSKREVGSEIELAANRKPYYTDEVLEGRKLDRTLTYGLLGLFVVALGLPLYWLNEPGRQNGETKDLEAKFVKRGAAMFAPTAQGGFNCAFCHGDKGVGGAAPYTITNSQGDFVASVTWKAPALNTVLQRYSREEVTYVLTYGRPFSPMPAWGLKGNGPLNAQQIQNLVDYLQSIQLTPKQAQAEVKTELAKAMKEKNPTCVENKQAAAKSKLPASKVADFDITTVNTSSCPNAWKTEGEALFNLGYNDGFAGGAYSCGRCHTKGWSYGKKQADGRGAFGPPLTNETNQFPGAVLGVKTQTEFVCTGSEQGKLYGSNGQGSGRMPGYCVTPEEKADQLASGEVGVNTKTAGTPEQGAMMTQEDVRKVVLYERGLSR